MEAARRELLLFSLAAESKQADTHCVIEFSTLFSFSVIPGGGSFWNANSSFCNRFCKENEHNMWNQAQQETGTLKHTASITERFWPPSLCKTLLLNPVGVSPVPICVCCPFSSHWDSIVPKTFPLRCYKHQLNFLRLKKSSQPPCTSIRPLTTFVAICWWTPMSFLYWGSSNTTLQMWSCVSEREVESLSSSCWLHACAHSPIPS